MNSQLRKRYFCTDKQGRNSDRRGAAAVEFAVVAPIFFVLVIAAFEFGRLNVMRHTADNAAYEAARHAMVPGATAAEAVQRATSILNIVGTRGATVTINPSVIDESVEEITVTIDVPMNQNGWITPRFSSATNIQASSRLRTERAGN
ncbi:TadE/TadG family type IV pilus assembly protein [Adhaeretor mobilis]|uniref:TadE-like protein n=1 Tax=Adhaeretor mobilis TaxID=1930276 RepID=A0A517MPL9_9BACT|nr:TadE/TadG family type IV pilus assembly protein [Adhaeretor mobilis]QDS96828.1 TadE-like protein [Adhaeretor mobilis]